jgi:hypothetical protein
MKKSPILTIKCKCGHPRSDHRGLTGDCCNVSAYQHPHVCQCPVFKKGKQ